MTLETPATIARVNTLWQIEIFPAAGQTDRLANEIVADAADLNLVGRLKIRCARGFLVEGKLDESQVLEIARDLLVEPVVEEFSLSRADDKQAENSSDYPVIVHVLPKPGVTDAEAETALRQLKQLRYPVDAIRTFKKYQIERLSQEKIDVLYTRILSNDSIEQVVIGPLNIDHLTVSNEYVFELNSIDLLTADDQQLMNFSRDGGLSLTLVEMQTIQQHFVDQQRNPTDIELETIAQTWSEHCSHKTLAGRIDYRDENGSRQFENMLKETIFSATQTIRAELGADDWCVSVFKDNAGIVKFDEQSNITFKVETHNRPSALEPYGGANTGIGGVIRDTLGTGMGAKPICNTDVFCFAPPNTSVDQLPPSVLHPRRIMKGVVAGVRDYGNRMGIPTVNGAVYFDRRYVGNPLVFCGNIGLIPHEMSFKQPAPDDLIVTVGGQTGRDGIHGATFSSAELTEESEQTSGGAVQIGNAITEKMVTDVLLQARDRGLYNAITDCGAGGFSSAVGEMGVEIGAEVWLEKAPLKYQGLSYTEIWISEAQERMVVSVPAKNWDAFESLCRSESVEATVIGKFVPHGRLKLLYEGQQVADLEMQFLHDGRPPVLRAAVFQPIETKFSQVPLSINIESTLMKILGSPNVASKHWVIRQYDHEVLGGSVIKPLVGISNDGPSDAAVVRPKLDSRRGIAISCGMNPHYGDIDPYHMAASSIDEAVRNCVAVGADPRRIAILDNFCWGYTDRPETLGGLVRAALACQQLAIELKTPFISGKDSLNNEFSYRDHDGSRQTISIPATLLISAVGQVPDVAQCVTMDFKTPGNLVFLIGKTCDELGGSHFNLVNDLAGGAVPKVDGGYARRTFEAIHAAISNGLVRACHDLSEGGLAVAASEMSFAGGTGVQIDLNQIELPSSSSTDDNIIKLFAESNTRFLCEVPPELEESFVNKFAQVRCAKIGAVTDQRVVRFVVGQEEIVVAKTAELKSAWRNPLDWS